MVASKFYGHAVVLILSMCISASAAMAAEVTNGLEGIPGLEKYHHIPLEAVVELTAEEVEDARDEVGEIEDRLLEIDRSIISNAATASALAIRGESTEHTSGLFEQLSALAAADIAELAEAKEREKKALTAHAAAVAKLALEATLDTAPNPILVPNDSI